MVTSTLSLSLSRAVTTGLVFVAGRVSVPSPSSTGLDCRVTRVSWDRRSQADSERASLAAQACFTVPHCNHSTTCLYSGFIILDEGTERAEASPRVGFDYTASTSTSALSPPWMVSGFNASTKNQSLVLITSFYP